MLDKKRSCCIGITIALGVLLGASCLAAIVAASFALRFYDQLAALRLAPTFEDRYARENSALAPPAGRRVVVFGDSRVRQWQPRPSRSGYEFIWRGIGGESTAQMVHRFEQDTIAIGASLIVLEAGINDLTAAAALDPRKSVVDDTVRNISAMLRIASNAGSCVILMTVIPPSTPPLIRRLVWSDEIYARVRELNGKLRALAKPSVLVLDAQSALSGPDGRLRPDLATDTLHLNRKAYEILNRALTQPLGHCSGALQ